MSDTGLLTRIGRLGTVVFGVGWVGVTVAAVLSTPVILRSGAAGLFDMAVLILTAVGTGRLTRMASLPHAKAALTASWAGPLILLVETVLVSDMSPGSTGLRVGIIQGLLEAAFFCWLVRAYGALTWVALGPIGSDRGSRVFRFAADMPGRLWWLLPMFFLLKGVLVFWLVSRSGSG